MTRAIDTSISTLRTQLADAIKACGEKGITVPSTTKVSGLTSYISNIVSFTVQEPVLVLGADFKETTQTLISEPRAIVFTRENIPTDTETVDVSLEQDNSIQAWAVDDTLYVGTVEGYIHSEDCTELFSSEDENTTLEVIDFDNFFVKDSTSMKGMFKNLTALKEVDFYNYATGNVTDMSEMFENCKSLEEINISNFATYNVEDMSRMFKGCTSLKELNLSTLQTDKVQNAEGMFEDCKNLEDLDISSFNFDNETEIEDLFTNCKSLKNIKCDSLYKTDDLVEVEEKEIPVVDVFKGCNSLEDYSENKISTVFAVPVSEGGYFVPVEKI